MPTELEELGKLVWLRKRLLDGSAKQLCKKCGITTGEVGRIIHLSQPAAAWTLSGNSFPRSRDTALALADLLLQLELMLDE